MLCVSRKVLAQFGPLCVVEDGGHIGQSIHNTFGGTVRYHHLSLPETMQFVTIDVVGHQRLDQFPVMLVVSLDQREQLHDRITTDRLDLLLLILIRIDSSQHPLQV